MTDETDAPGERSRRTLLKLTVAALVVGLAPRAQAQQKLAQNLVQYQDKPKNGQECDQCMHFVPPSSTPASTGGRTIMPLRRCP